MTSTLLFTFWLLKERIENRESGLSFHKTMNSDKPQWPQNRFTELQLNNVHKSEYSWSGCVSFAGLKRVAFTPTSERWWCRLTLTVPWTFTVGTPSSSTKAESYTSALPISSPSLMLRTKPWSGGTKTPALLSQVGLIFEPWWILNFNPELNRGNVKYKSKNNLILNNNLLLVVINNRL